MASTSQGSSLGLCVEWALHAVFLDIAGGMFEHGFPPVKGPWACFRGGERVPDLSTPLEARIPFRSPLHSTAPQPTEVV